MVESAMSEPKDPYGRGPRNARYKSLPPSPPPPPTTTTPLPQHPREFRYAKSIEESKKKHPVDGYGRSLDREILQKVEERRSKPPDSELAKRKGAGR